MQLELTTLYPILSRPFRTWDILKCVESRGNGQVSDVTGSAGVTGRYLAKAIISDKSK